MSKTRKKRIFGMTVTQLLILGCLALAAVGTIFGSFILISSPTTPDGLSLFPSPAPTLSNEPAVPSDQVEGSGSLSIPTPVLGSNEIPPDWKQYSATTIEIKVPPQFIPSENINTTRQDRISFYRGQGFEFLAARLENDSFDYRFWFDYPQPETVPYRTHIIVKADVLPTLTLDEYIDQAYGADLQGFQVADRREFMVGNLQARRIVLSANLNEISIGVAEYVISDEINLWIVSASTDQEGFISWLPVFDKVASSFHLRY